MLARQNRITAEKTINKFFGAQLTKLRGWTVASSLFVLKIIPVAKKNSRAAFIVSTKVDNRATERNRIKRQLREITRLNLKNFKQPVDLLVVVKESCKNRPNEIVKSDFQALLKKSQLL